MVRVRISSLLEHRLEVVKHAVRLGTFARDEGGRDPLRGARTRGASRARAQARTSCTEPHRASWQTLHSSQTGCVRHTRT